MEEAGVDGSEDEVEGTRVVVDVAEGRRVHGKAVERHHAVGRIEHLPNDRHRSTVVQRRAVTLTRSQVLNLLNTHIRLVVQI